MAVAAAIRGFEYDEAYLHFYVAGLAKLAWPIEPLPVGILRGWIEGQTAGFGRIASDLVELEHHPPLHFWIMALWREVFGPGHLVARVFSVLCTAGALALVPILARVARVPPLPALACTAFAYAVFYPGTLARAYALALLLTLAGSLALALLLREMQEERPRQRLDGGWLAFAAGLAFGLAGFSHYLAMLTATALLCSFAASALWRRRPLPVLFTGLGLLPPFVAVLAVRADQGSAEWFHPNFEPARDLVRLVEVQAAALFARTPVLFDEPWRALLALAIAPCLLLVGLALLAASRRLLTDPVRRMLLAGALAMPVGLVVLGALTDRAPFVSRYFSYGIPFVALCFAAGLGEIARARPRLAGVMLGYVLFWQVVGAGSQVVWPATQQEFRGIVAAASRHWEPGASVLAVPIGYDGIGKNAPYLWEAPDDWPMAVVNEHNPAGEFLARLGSARRILLVTFVEVSGELAVEALHAALPAAGWRLQSTEPHLEVWTR
ncbi:glycosyltransferase family 39 protein [Falsiroseomonas oryziterrae]|uniref:glycosyltransferase family 39 protein n=1 Tax=Falsiroseomonas oryziterrae TaxID=2911368 RepID=UPI001F48B97A|nr:glycosyltransferase family 39 protein [Roseomonas sp. NPKOSM-4]